MNDQYDGPFKISQNGPVLAHKPAYTDLKTGKKYLYMCLQILWTTVQSCPHRAHSVPKKTFLKKYLLIQNKKR
jgi:hypothetical protein